MKQPKPLITIKQTKKDKERAKIMGQIMDAIYPKEEREQAFNWRMFMQKADEANPPGLIKVEWKKDNL